MQVYDSCAEVLGMLAKKPEGFDGFFRRVGYTALLPLLRMPHRRVLSELSKALAEAGASPDVAAQISPSALVAFALRSPSEFWAGQAIRWLSEGFPIDVDILKAGDEMITSKRGTQSTRRDLFRTLRKWERKRYGSRYTVRLSLLRVLVRRVRSR